MTKVDGKQLLLLFRKVVHTVIKVQSVFFFLQQAMFVRLGVIFQMLNSKHRKRY